MTNLPRTLGDLGEREIIRSILSPRYASDSHFGDDCAQLEIAPKGVMLLSTDPAPRPVAFDLGITSDLYYWGWLLAALNLSDLAAAGAEPSGLLSSLTLPSDTPIVDFTRMLDGIDACCTSVGARVLGGNLKEAVDGVLRAEATAVGYATGDVWSRKGATAGDVLVAFGPTGSFWASALLYFNSLDSEPDWALAEQSLLLPMPQNALAVRLRDLQVVHAATDASDGLYAAVASLTSEQSLGAELDMQSWNVSGAVSAAAHRLKVPKERLVLGFGDLQLVCAVPANRLQVAVTAAEEFQVESCVLGKVSGSRGIRVSSDHGWQNMSNFDNERFTGGSQFTSGISGYVERLLGTPLPD